MMQQPENRQKGTNGEAAVGVFFGDLGWGPIHTGNHDLGTDLYVQIRDDERRELLQMIGVQVKTGDSELASRGVVDGEPGWWFAESDQKHANYWRNHPIPHIIVLQNTSRSTQVWNFLNNSTILNTGKGFKVFVPASQTLDADSVGLWIHAANSALKKIALDGSRWDFQLDTLSADDHARYALLVPRLIEPHPNKGQGSPISWPEAIALCVQADADRWEAFAERHEDVPTISEAATSVDWGWRFAHAVHNWIYEGSADALENLSTGDVGYPFKVAHAIALSLALVDADRPEDAIRTLGALAIDKEYTADQGWLSVHRARLAINAADLERGQLLSEQAVIQLATISSDVTVSALRAGASWSLFETAAFDEQNVGNVASAMDTVSSWWRTQSVASGLELSANHAFAEWVDDGRVTFERSSVQNYLFSASVTARLAGSHSQATHTQALFALVTLASAGVTDDAVANALDELRRAGDYKNLAAALRKIRRDGPVSALQSLIDTIRPHRMNRVDSHANLVAIRLAGPFARGELGTKLVEFVLGALEDQTSFTERVDARYLVSNALTEALSGVVAFATPDQEQRLIAWIIDLPDTPNQVLEGALSRIGSGISAASRKRDARILADRFETDGLADWYRWLLIWLAGPNEPLARAAMRTGLLAGNLDALGALERIDLLADDEAQAVLAACAHRIATQRHEAQKGTFTAYGSDRALTFAKTILLHPEAGDWTELLQYLADPVVAPASKRPTLELLLGEYHRLPTTAAVDLYAAIRALATTSPSEPALSMSAPLGGLMDVATLTLDTQGARERDDLLLALLSGDSWSRADCARYLASSATHSLVLSALSADSDRRVAAAAMFALAQQVGGSKDPSPAAIAALNARLDSNGEGAALAITAGLKRNGTIPGAALDPLITRLKQHPSASVRRLADGL